MAKLALAFGLGFLVGAYNMYDVWSEATQRGVFSIDNKVYRVQQVQP